MTTVLNVLFILCVLANISKDANFLEGGIYASMSIIYDEFFYIYNVSQKVVVSIVY